MVIITRKEESGNKWTAYIKESDEHFYTGTSEAEALGNLMLGIRDALSQHFTLFIISEEEVPAFTKPDEIPDRYTHW